MKTDLKLIAKSRGGEYLGLSRIDNSQKKYLWRCDQGHTWEARADHVIRGSWCPICKRNNQKNTIDSMRKLAKQRDGECLSQIYINARTRLIWRCKEGHIFEATPSKIKQGRWCKKCGDQVTGQKRRITMQEIMSIADLHNGKCLSDEYNPKKHLKWQCEFGHNWYANLHNVKSGSWCPICGHKKSGRKVLTIEEMRKIAAAHRGKCLSNNYVNVESKLKWECEKGHIWMAIPSAIKKGHWCPVCVTNYWLDIEDMKKIARERGGKCLSEKYKNVRSKLKWQCAEGHTWFANYSNISIGRWCPECSSSIGERICRVYFEQLFENKFPKTRPKWLVNQDGNQMELDGYCKELALAFEHQGRQHYRDVDHFYSSEYQFRKRQSDDSRKKLLCKKNNVRLIEVPQIPDLLPVFDVQSYILKKCSDYGIQTPDDAVNKKVKLQKAYSPAAKEKMEQICEIVTEQSGKCLSTTYVGSNQKMRFRCQNGHEWETIPYVILKGHWCPKCSDSKRGFARRLTIDDMNQIALERGGRCISQTYINANEVLLWECSKGHQWRAVPNSIKRGSWCPVCSRENRQSKVRQTEEEKR